MIPKEKLYDSFGELVYVIAMADGIIQQEETDTLHKLLVGHPWACEIEWSFNYEKSHHSDIDYLYNKVLDICYQNGPDPEYQNLLEILEAVAAASDGVDIREKAVINKFTSDLIVKFKNDLAKI